MGDNPTREIAEWVAGLRYEEIPQAAIDNAKVAILDTIGVTLAGSMLEPGKVIQDYVEAAGASPVATVCASSVKTSPELAALANGVLAHVQDYDDRWHTSTHTLPAVMAMGEASGVDGRQLLVSYIAGREVRLHLDEEFRPGRDGKGDGAAGKGPGWRGWHETGVLGSIGAAAAAAKTIGLSADEVQMALGIGASTASGLMANFGTSTKSLHAGNAARNGVLAATLASRGFSADPEILMARRGFVEAICYPDKRDAGRVAESLRSYFHTAKHGVRIKPLPVCTGTQQFVTMMQAIVSEHGLVPDDVSTITVSRITGAGPRRDFPSTSVECKFSPAFLAVATLIDGEVNLDNCTMEFARRHDVQSLMSRTTYETSDKGFIRIETSSGATIEQAALPGSVSRGSPARDLEGLENIESKFHNCADRIIGRVRAEQVRSLVKDLEQLESVTSLMKLLSVN